jgi:hypothetical protein
MDVAAGHHRFATTLQVGWVETAPEAALAASQLVAYLGIHSKYLRGLGGEKSRYSSNTRKRRGISSFFMRLGKKCRGVRLVKV